MKVTAAIFRDGDWILLMRRAADQPLAGEWEYPGGKFEDGEDGPTCLRRELTKEQCMALKKYQNKKISTRACFKTKVFNRESETLYLTPQNEIDEIINGTN